MRRAIVAMLTTFLLFSMLNAMFNVTIVAASPEIIRVPQDYPKIRWAIGNASGGETIIVSEGTYAEGQINVDKSLTLLANGTVTVDGLQEGHVFYVTANNVNITGFTIKNSRPKKEYAGIYLEGAQYCNVTSNTVTNNWHGIRLSNSSYNNLAENDVKENLFTAFYCTGLMKRSPVTATT